MEYEVQTNRSWQLAALLLTVFLIGGAIAYAFSVAG